MKELTKTCRSKGAVGPNAVVPKMVANLLALVDGLEPVLDYGAGKDAIHAKRLREKGYKVDAYEIGENKNDNHIKFIIPGKYSLVYASNVLNVQPTTGSLIITIMELWMATKKGGSLIANYPNSPRKGGFKVKQVRTLLEEYFDLTETKYSSGVIFEGRRK